MVELATFAGAAAKYAGTFIASKFIDARRQGRLEQVYSKAAGETVEYFQEHGCPDGTNCWRGVIELLQTDACVEAMSLESRLGHDELERLRYLYKQDTPPLDKVIDRLREEISRLAKEIFPTEFQGLVNIFTNEFDSIHMRLARIEAKLEFNPSSSSKPPPVAVSVEGCLDGVIATLKVRNNSDETHKFRVRLHGVEGTLEGQGAPNVNKWLSKATWIKWNSASTNEWETIGPRLDADAFFAKQSEKGRHGDIPYAGLQYQCVGISQAEQGKIYSRVAFGGTIECEIEIQSTALMLPYRETWILTLDGDGMPMRFEQSGPDREDIQSEGIAQ